MKRCLLLLPILAVLAFTVPAQALTLSHVSAQPRYPADDQAVSVRFKLSAPAEVTLSVYDARDLRVRRVTQDFAAGGDQAIRWDRNLTTGRTAPPGAYHYVLAAEDDSGTRVRHDLTDTTGGKTLPPPEAHWDPEAGRIRYRLTEPARVNIRVGLQDGGPLLNTVANWVARAPGDRTQHWDGYDESRVLDISRHPKLQIAVSAFTLSDNTIILGDQDNARPELAELGGDTESRPGKSDKPPPRMHDYARQSFAERGDFPIRLVLPEDLPRTEQGVPIVSGEAVPVRLEVPEPYRRIVQAERYEPVFFVDGVFAFENEVGFLPMTWRWSTQGVGPGEHYLTANLRGYNGNFGMATVKVRVQPRQD